MFQADAIDHRKIPRVRPDGVKLVVDCHLIQVAVEFLVGFLERLETLVAVAHREVYQADVVWAELSNLLILPRLGKKAARFIDLPIVA